MKRRNAIKTTAGTPMATVAGKGKKPQTKRVVLPLKATRRFEAIIRDGGVINEITVSYTLPSRPGFVSFGKIFLFGKEVEDIEIK